MEEKDYPVETYGQITVNQIVSDLSRYGKITKREQKEIFNSSFYEDESYRNQFIRGYVIRLRNITNPKMSDYVLKLLFKHLYFAGVTPEELRSEEIVIPYAQYIKYVDSLYSAYAALGSNRKRREEVLKTDHLIPDLLNIVNEYVLEEKPPKQWEDYKFEFGRRRSRFRSRKMKKSR